MSTVSFDGIQKLYCRINELYEVYTTLANEKALFHGDESMTVLKAGRYAKKILDECFNEYQNTIKKEYGETDYKELMEASMENKRNNFYLYSFKTKLQKILRKEVNVSIDNSSVESSISS